MKILLFGGSGLLGKELIRIDPQIVHPTHAQCDIGYLESVRECVAAIQPDIIINAAAATDNRKIVKNPAPAVKTNIIGAANVALAAAEIQARLVYLSTDYVYAGEHGNYRETDPLQPFNLYAWTKLGGECSTRTVKNHLIIRTTFGASMFSYPKAFTDKWSSKDYVNVIAPLIYQAAVSPLCGVLNLATARKTIYDHARERNDQVLPITIADSAFNTQADTSLNLQRWIDYQSGAMIKPQTRCRCCGSDRLRKYIDLGLLPLANSLSVTSQLARTQERFPLQVLFCEDCYLSQLSVVVNPRSMFSNYTYRSGINQGYITHCQQMAAELQERCQLTADSFHVDIAGNDGTLLKQFKQAIGLRVLNVDPAANLVAIAESEGIESLVNFWSVPLAEQIVQTHGQADLITATNVFAHVDNVAEFMVAAGRLLKPDGLLVLEFPYLVDFITAAEFDTIYFEHLSYFSILPLNRLCAATGMKIVDVEKQTIHGGTVRVTLARDDSMREATANVERFIASEQAIGVGRFEWYAGWAKRVQDLIANFAERLVSLKMSGKRIAAFAASAKGNTLLNSANIGTDIIDYIIDETPEKIGRFSPGTGIPIVHKQTLLKHPPDYMVILSWNFAEEIMEKLKPIYHGQYIIPTKMRLPVFIHIPRTGGNSIIKALEGKDAITVHHVSKVDLNGFGDNYVFAFMRDPCERVLSAYAYLSDGGLSDEDAEDAREYIQPFADFREFVLGGLQRAAAEQRHFRPQCYWLTDDQDQIVANFIGRTENLQAGFDFVCEQAGWERTPLDVLNRSDRTGLEVGDDLRAIIREIYAEDFQMIEIMEAMGVD